MGEVEINKFAEPETQKQETVGDNDKRMPKEWQKNGKKEQATFSSFRVDMGK